MNSLRNTDYKTMDPVDRFTTPRPPPAPGHRREFRIASGSSIFPKRATRSVSPAPSWTGTARRLLGFKSHHRDAERGRKSGLRELEDVFIEEQDPSSETRSITPSGSIRSRDLSPESLRRFLSDDVPSLSADHEITPGLSIPDDIVEEAEENDDDDNFATAAATESTSFTTLSPPPFQRGGLSAPPASHARNATRTAPDADAEVRLSTEQDSSVAAMRLDILQSHSTVSAASSSMASPASPQSNLSLGLSQFSFFDDSDDDEDLASYECDGVLLTDADCEHDADNGASKLEMEAPITSYSLPRASTYKKKHSSTNHILPSVESPALVARNDNGVPVGTSNVFSLPNVDIGLEDLVNDMNWMADVIRQKEV
ncbi:hypothetical protein HD806DRAFT_474648 [Xylariaceae sp. AK1471]|nr:hypothetical protein HD806DRAFT_474648 [Xylariaceae sp. AK1471]